MAPPAGLRGFAVLGLGCHDLSGSARADSVVRFDGLGDGIDECVLGVLVLRALWSVETSAGKKMIVGVPYQVDSSAVLNTQSHDTWMVLTSVSHIEGTFALVCIKLSATGSIPRHASFYRNVCQR